MEVSVRPVGCGSGFKILLGVFQTKNALARVLKLVSKMHHNSSSSMCTFKNFLSPDLRIPESSSICWRLDLISRLWHYAKVQHYKWVKICIYLYQSLLTLLLARSPVVCPIFALPYQMAQA